jgi:hypothetical protein
MMECYLCLSETFNTYSANCISFPLCPDCRNMFIREEDLNDTLIRKFTNTVNGKINESNATD